ncbi:uncharacterized protein LOC133036194 [Cannabis sativa]|uniref:uncharacterized protein LOC133036194 n=1 Tax=Cannabis sativa TaxID=3483 RepID=UPI0029CA0E8A|nr:uncharacterized protein LOC133036194 [Cannabis sativa]
MVTCSLSSTRGINIKRFSSVSRPQASGQVKAINKTLKDTIKKKLDDAKGRWVDELPQVLWAHTATRNTPFSLEFGLEAMLSMEVVIFELGGMEMFREGGSTSRPPMLEGANYPYCKTKMRAFLRAVNERVWMAIEDGWTCPTMMDNGVTKPKPTSLWTPDEMERANFNSKAMHALFNAVSTNQLKVIANCEMAKEAWEKLRIKNEGTDAVKKSRLRALAKAFEDLSMEEEETVAEFHAKLCDISNESYALGKTYSNAKLVRKVLGVLPRRFMSKVTSIEEMRNVEELDLDELIGSLQNYEMSLTRWKKEKKKKDVNKEKGDNNIAFIHKEEKKSIPDLSAGFSDEAVDLLTKNYAKFLKKKYKKLCSEGKENASKRNPLGNFWHGQQPSDNKSMRIQCRECDGFGHIQVECANTLKKKKALVATWSDSDEEKDSIGSKSSNEDKQVVAFMAQSHQSVESEDDGVSTVSEVDSNGRQNAYEEMFAQWEYMTMQIRGLNSAKEQIESEKVKLEDTVKNLNKLLDEKDNEIYKLSAELIRAKQALEFIPPGTAAINQTLQLQKPYGDRTSIGYKMLYKQVDNLGVEESITPVINLDKKDDKQSSFPSTPQSSNPTGKFHVPSGPTKVKLEGRRIAPENISQMERFIPVCHFCNRRGHIRPRCYKLQNYLKAMINRPKSFQKPNKTRKEGSQCEWRLRADRESNFGLVAQVSLSAFLEGQLYLNSCCSRHMMGNKKLLVNYKESKEGAVTFGDGNKGHIIGKGDFVMSRAAPLTEVLYVKGLKANLISIGKRSSDGSYLLDNVVLCNSASLDKSDIGDFSAIPKVLTKRNKSVKSSPRLSRSHSLLLVLWYGLLNFILLNLGFKQRNDDVFVLLYAGFDHVVHRTPLLQKKYDTHMICCLVFLIACLCVFMCDNESSTNIPQNAR